MTAPLVPAQAGGAASLVPASPGAGSADRPATARVADRRVPNAKVAARAAGVAAVLLFWWGVTGVLLALQRSAGTRLLALGLAIAAAGGGLALTARVRRVAGPEPGGSAGAAAAAVLAGALLWTCVSAAFYGGWIVGPALGGVPAPHAVTLAHAARAVAATAYSSALALALLAAAWHLAGGREATGRGPAVFAPLTFAVLWGAHELAKLNVFLGVANPGAELLPVYLAPLRAYFGPERNSPLLGVSVAGLAAVAAGMAFGASRRTAGPGRRTGLALVAGVLALAALEHALLGVHDPVGWWDAFLRWRGAP